MRLFVKNKNLLEAFTEWILYQTQKKLQWSWIWPYFSLKQMWNKCGTNVMVRVNIIKKYNPPLWLEGWSADRQTADMFLLLSTERNKKQQQWSMYVCTKSFSSNRLYICSDYYHNVDSTWLHCWSYCLVPNTLTYYISTMWNFVFTHFRN